MLGPSGLGRKRSDREACCARKSALLPGGDPDCQNPDAIAGVARLRLVLDAAARNLKAHGASTRSCFIGDSGGNQGGIHAVANALNTEWKDAGVKVFAITDYYEGGREHYRAWPSAREVRSQL